MQLSVGYASYTFWPLALALKVQLAKAQMNNLDYSHIQNHI